MTSKRLFVVFLVIFAGFFLAGDLFPQGDTVLLPKTGHRKPQILFNHRAHSEDYDAECNECHHEQKDEDEAYHKCSTCHEGRDRGHVLNLKGAFHQQCHDCHRKTSGPKACGRCHKKNR